VARTSEAKRSARWLVGSLGLHALLLGFAATRLAEERTASAPPAHASEPPDIELDLEPLLDQVETSAPASADEFAPAASAKVASPSSIARAQDQAEPSPEADAAASSEGDAATDPEDDGAPPASAPPRLGLAQLGLVGPNRFVDRDSALGPALLPAPPGRHGVKRRDVKKDLEATFARSTHQHDVELGLGAGSPVMRSLEAAVYASSAPLNGSAQFTFVIDSEGKLVSSSLGQVSSERDQWERVAREAAQKLAAQKMRVPKGKGVRLTIALTSHLELPSGRDPGVEVQALGIPIKKGQGPRSTRIEILNPLKAAALALDGDPVDAVARPRRMVRSHVVSEELL
jgi:hypothetical protein